MRSYWIDYNDKQIFYQDFSKLFYNTTAVIAELAEVKQVVMSQPKGSVLVLTDMRDTNVGKELLLAMNAASAETKEYVKKTAVLGVTGLKLKLGSMLSSLTGQPFKYFDDMETAKNWLVVEED